MESEDKQIPIESMAQSQPKIPATPEQKPETELQPAPIKPKKEKKGGDDKEKKHHVQTLYTDMSNLMGTYDGGKISQLIKEHHDKQDEEEEFKRRKKKNLNYILFSLILVIVSIAGVMIVNYVIKPKPLPVVSNVIPTIFSAERNHALALDGLESPMDAEEQLKKHKNESSFPAGSIEHIYFTTTGVRLETLELFDTLGVGENIPATLRSQLHPMFMYGSYMIDQHYPFLILQVQGLESGREGMKSWESTLADDIGFLFDLDETLVQTGWEDRVMRNKDTRVLSGYPLITSTTLVPKETILPDTENIPLETGTIEEEVMQEATETQDILQTQEQREGTSTDESVMEGEDMLTVEQVVAEPEPPVQEFVEITTEDPGPEEIMLMYFFLDESTLAITTHPSVIQEIVSRYARSLLGVE